MLSVTSTIVIPRHELRFRFDRSRGPGGQNVNKTNSKATLHWCVRDSGSLSDDVRQRFLEKFANRISQAGDVVLSSDRHRDQKRNLDACLELLREMLLEAAAPPPQARRRTRPSGAARRRRMENKRRRSETKQMRRPPRGE